MELSIFLILLRDGLVNGAIHAMPAMAIVLIVAAARAFQHVKLVNDVPVLDNAARGAHRLPA